MNKEFIEEVKKSEGFKENLYYCTAGKLTIGYGRNIEDIGIRKEEANIMLINDLNSSEVDLYRAYPKYTYLSPSRREALIDMVFNMGIVRVKHFKRMHAALEEGNFKQAAIELMDSNYAVQVGMRAQRNRDKILNG